MRIDQDSCVIGVAICPIPSYMFIQPYYCDVSVCVCVWQISSVYLARSYKVLSVYSIRSPIAFFALSLETGSVAFLQIFRPKCALKK